MNQNSVIMDSTLICPKCGHSEKLVMPEDYCLFYHQCNSCSVMLKPKAGDCCVFCSYGDVPCPPIQLEKGCCG